MKNVLRMLVIFKVISLHATAFAVERDGSATVRSGALSLSWDDVGRVVGVRVGSDDVVARDVSEGGFSLRDCASQNSHEVLLGKLRAQSKEHIDLPDNL